MILSQKNIEEIAVAVIRDFQKSFFGSEADDPARFALPVSYGKLSFGHRNPAETVSGERTHAPA